MHSSPRGFGPLAPAFVTVGGRRTEVFDTGTSRPDEPVVVVLTGAGDTARSWLPVQATLSEELRVISYERSGIGASAPGSPRTLEGLVDELDAVIAALVPREQVVLVGHSFGALVARVYASRHPGHVAGLVMIDATPDLLTSDALRRVGYRLYVESIAAMRAVLPRAVFARLVTANVLPYYPGRGPFLRMLNSAARTDWDHAVRELFLGDAVEEMRAVLPGTAAASLELGTAGTSGADAGGADAPMLGDLPVALLTSGTYGRGWITLHDAIARRYPRATHRLSGDRFHNVHMRHVDLTVRTVRAVVEAGRDPAGGGRGFPGA